MNVVKKLTLWLLIATLVLTALSACTPSDIGGQTPPDTNDTSTPPALDEVIPESLTISIAKVLLMVGETVDLDYDSTPAGRVSVTYEAAEGASHVSIEGDRITALSPGTITLIGHAGEVKSQELIISVIQDADPYVGMTAEQFYANYTPAVSYLDASYRTQHGFMSGELTVPDQAPTVSSYQPKRDDMLIRNANTYYSDNNNTYTIVDAYGREVMEIYRGAAYITLEEVAAYVYAFGHIPANYIGGKNASPSSSVWGEYLRLNHSQFSGSTTKYPYEPALPDISGCGGDLQYYEIDIGTTGTDCDPGYVIRTYNDGNRITRGAARIVYARFDKNGDNIIDPNEKYVFYTYNHYNDFQEYLNYYGGWGEMFGNVTGGGVLSDKKNCNPTPYVPVWRGNLGANMGNAAAADSTYEVIVAFLTPAAWPGRRYA
ncbi:MAG: hypothetical protein E7625_03505 [Ruminococcaceae bacterium]|nr:hypothetical protein [Oscillospiraceae bacterium]